MRNLRKQTGFTLIELLIVVAIIGIIAAIAIPNLLNAIDRGKQKRSMADMRSLGTACESYAVDTNFYPISTSMATLDSLDPATIGIEPVYIKLAPTKDGWGGLYYYGSDTAGAGSDYTITTYAKDKTVSSGSAGATQDFDCDIIFQNGTFTAYPEGVQT
ncbi:MAG TPA: prepilin-type N-terminal cleavage/methylation domain-containing protein [Candidatus Polarisedimenticolia bacterium]|nr:prepilin-type N-terminal cleavage/methylation domain-containing protein [Candidatus Polarisedimenticolia bacterium]